MQAFFQSQPFLLLGLLALAGFYFGRLAQFARLPSLIGFMILGVILGPSILGFFNETNLASLTFITDLALGFVAFSIGSELVMKSLGDMGKGITAIILAESFGAFIVVTAVIYLITRSLPLAILFGAVAPASAPAGTVAVIQEYRAKGRLTTALYAVVGFDDGLAILIFGFAAALAENLLTAELGVPGASSSVIGAMGRPALEILYSLLLGTGLGFLLGVLLRALRQSRESLVMVVGTVFIATGLSLHLGLSLILTNMAVGFVLANTRRESFLRRATDPVRELMPLLFILFFGLAGAHLRLSQLPKLGIVGIGYVLARSAGLIGGSRIGGVLGHIDEKVKNWIGLGILSQAGVAIGLSLIISNTFAAMMKKPDVSSAVSAYKAVHVGESAFLYDPSAIGAAIITVVTATSIIFEIIGPILTKVALSKVGEIGKDQSGESQEG
jgi:Kef-type K+ transport system membrane component KefB